MTATIVAIEELKETRQNNIIVGNIRIKEIEVRQLLVKLWNRIDLRNTMKTK